MAETVFYNNRNLVGIGNVGIGTTNPGAPLQVHGYGGGGDPLRLASVTTGDEVGIGFYRNTDLTISATNGDMWVMGHNVFGAGDRNFGIGCNGKNIVMAMIGSNGNVGIGTTSPSCPLMVATGSGQYTPAIGVLESTHATSTRASINLGEGVASWTLGQDTSGNGTRDFFIYGGSSPSTKFYISTDGKVGISTINPATALDVYTGTMNAASVTVSTAYNTSGVAGVYQVGGTTVIDASRNLTNIGTVGSGAITSASTVSGTTLTASTAYNTSGTGVYQVGGTTVIDASRNLTNIGTVTAIATPTATSNVLTVRGSSTTGNVVQFSNTNGGTFIMTSAGRVGIGTANPGVTLDVTGTVRASTQFSGPGTGLTGTASSLSVGSATTAFQLSTTFPNNQILFGVGTGIPYSEVGFVYNNGFVGIGTASPGVTLDVTGTVRASTQFSGPGTGLTGTASGLTVGAATNATNLSGGSVSATTGYFSGSVGIGSASPGTKLDVVGDMRVAQGYTYIGGAGAQNAAFALNYIDTTSSYKSLIFGRANSFSNAGEVNFNYVGPGSASNWLGLGFYANYPVAITAGGNMGIGITNPVSKLHAFTGVSGTVASFVSSGGEGSYSNVDISTYLNGSNVPTTRIAVIDESYSGHFTILTKTPGSENNVLNERMRIKNNGNVGIGTTNPASTFEVIGGNIRTYKGSDIARLILGPAPSATNLDYCSMVESQSVVASNYGSILRLYTHGTTTTAVDPTTRLTIDANGTVYLSAYTTNGTVTTINSTGQISVVVSDSRIKSNIIPITSNSIDIINELVPTSFTFNHAPSEKRIGFIAQEVEKWIPEAVDGKKYEYEWELDSLGAPKLDDSGNLIMTDRPRYRALDTLPIITLAVKAIQELSAKNTDLETQLQTAQNDIDLLESRLAAIEALIGTNTSADTGTTSSGTRADALLSQV